MNRNELLLSLLDVSGVGLEIGPGFDPLVPKSSGRRVWQSLTLRTGTRPHVRHFRDWSKAWRTLKMRAASRAITFCAKLTL